jgi:hypothetical protein
MLEWMTGLLAQSNSLIFDNLLEILLSIILMFNVGAFTFLWRRVEDKSDEIDDIDEKISEIERVQDSMWNRFYGHEDDETSEGHLMETEERFDELNRKLERIAENQENARRERKEDHKEVYEKVTSIIHALDKEDGVDIGIDDIEK